MKRYISCIGLLFFGLISFDGIAQNGYVFTVFEREYAPVELADTISPTNWDDPEITITLPSPMRILGRPFNDFFVSDGAIFSTDVVADSLFAIIPFLDDLVSNQLDTNVHLSPMLLEQSLVDPIYTVEWRNAYFYILDGFFDFVNFQVQYYSDGSLEFCYGPGATELVTVAYREEGEVFGGLIGIGGGTQDTLLTGLFVEGENGTERILKDELASFIGFPNENTVYRFEVGPNSVDEAQDERCFDYIHIPELRQIQIRNTQDEVAVVSMTGQVVQQWKGAGLYSMADLPTGVYHIQHADCSASATIIHHQ